MPTFESSGCNGSVRALEQRDFLIRWGRRLACVLVLAALGFASVRAYGVWRLRHLEQQTQDFVERREFQSAVLVARRLLDLDQNNLTACRAMAEMAEQSGRAEAVAWRQRVAHIEPNATANQLALAKAALRFGQKELGEHVLKTLSTSAPTLEYHQLAGAAALARGDHAQAEAEFRAALKLDPQSAHVALNLAIVRLTSRDAAAGDEARASLAALVQQPDVRTAALRALAADALARKEREPAQHWAGQLHAEAGATFTDELLYFQAVEGSDLAADALHQLQTKAAASPATAAELLTWLNRQGMAVVAAEWGSRLPTEILSVQPVPLALAESFSFMQDWPRLRAWVEGKDWGHHEAFRLAVESHALHRLGGSDRESMEMQTVWRAALKAAQQRPEQIAAIAQLAEGWGYKRETEEAWWAAAAHGNNPQAALAALHRLYRAQQDTRGLLRVAKRAHELNPGDLVAANNSASLGLLLNGDGASRRLAARLHEAHPQNRAFAATYAYALHTEGKTAEGLQLIEKLKENELQHPAIAAYYVVMLVDNGQLARARLFLPNAQRATLLPEEQKLLTAASRKLAANETAQLRGVANR